MLYGMMRWYARRGWPEWTRRSMMRKISRRFDGRSGETALASGVRMHYRIGDPVDTALAVQGVFEPLLSSLIGGLAAQHASFVDVGCNIGYFTCLYAHANPDASILAIDANPDMTARCAANLGLNGFTPGPRLQVVNVGVGDRAGVLDLVVNSKRPSLASFGNAANEGMRRVPVSIKPLSAILDEHGGAAPEVLKIDIEGYEPALFAGLAERHTTRLRHVFFEYALGHMSRCGLDHREIWSHPMWSRFTLHAVGGDRPEGLALQRVLDGGFDGMIWARAKD